MGVLFLTIAARHRSRRYVNSVANIENKWRRTMAGCREQAGVAVRVRDLRSPPVVYNGCVTEVDFFTHMRYEGSPPNVCSIARRIASN